IVDHVLAFEGNGKIRDFTGNFSEYRERQKQEEAGQKEEKTKSTEVPAAKAAEPKNQLKKKLTFKEQRELEQIEKEMPETESARDEILKQLNNETDYQIIADLSTRLEVLTERLEEMEMRWLELQD